MTIIELKHIIRYLALFTLFSISLSFSVQAKSSSALKDQFVIDFEVPSFIKVLDHGLNSLKERIKIIRNARESIDVEYFIFNLDRSGKLFLSELIKKANEGIRVRILIDYFLTVDQINPFLVHELKKNNIEVKYYNRIRFLRYYRAQFRNHRKNLIVDDQVAITGGRNIGDEYFDMSSVFNFVDRDIVVTGNLAQYAANHFDYFWNNKRSKTRKRPSKPRLISNSGKNHTKRAAYKARLKKWKQSIKDAKSLVELLTSPDYDDAQIISSVNTLDIGRDNQFYKCNQPRLVSDIPKTRKHKKRFVNLELINNIKNAQKSLWIDSPYFIVNKKSRKLLDDSLNQGVNINVITNSLNSTDAIYISSVFYDTLSDWMFKGMNLYLFKGFPLVNYGITSQKVEKSKWGTHSKTYVFDDQNVMIGTYNFDPRSQNYNMEQSLVCYDSPELTAEILSRLQEKASASHLMDSYNDVVEDAWEGVGMTKAIYYYLMKIPAYIFKGLL